MKTKPAGQRKPMKVMKAAKKPAEKSQGRTKARKPVSQKALEDAILYRCEKGNDVMDKKKAAGVKIVPVLLGSTGIQDFPKRWTRKEGGKSVARGAAEWYVPDGADPTRRMLYLHGGTFVIWQPQDMEYRSLGTRIAKACGLCVLAIDYRNAPEHLFPAAYDDCTAALKWLATHGPHSSVEESPARDIFVAGDSAGGCLAVGICVAPPVSVRRVLRGLIGISAWTDMTASLPSYDTRVWNPKRCWGDAVNSYIKSRDDSRDEAEGYLGRGGVEKHGRKWQASPFFTPAPMLRKMPPTLLHVGDFELILDDSRLLCEKMKKAGHKDATCSIYPRMWHCWHMYTEGGGERQPLAKGLQAIREIGRWVAARKS